MTHRCRTCVPGRDLCETALTEAVIGEAHRLGWLVAHFRPARTEKGWRTAVQGDAGFPDLVLARRGLRAAPSQVLFIELKARRGDPSDDQRRWLAELPHPLILRPADWFAGRITEVLM